MISGRDANRAEAHRPDAEHLVQPLSAAAPAARASRACARMGGKKACAGRSEWAFTSAAWASSSAAWVPNLSLARIVARIKVVSEFFA
jgi:hypothetical protein